MTFSNNIPKIILKSGRDKSVLEQHPWLFSGAIKQLPQAENGDIVAVMDNHDQLLGYGFFSPKSQIICRLFAFTSTTFDEQTWQNYWDNKIAKAYELRKKYVISPQSNAFRLLHAEGDFFPGIIIDVYKNIAVIQLLIKGTEKIYPAITKALAQLDIQYIYLKMKENSHFLEEMTLSKGWATEKPPQELTIIENGYQFWVDIEKGQKTGFFIDQRDNRLLLTNYVKQKKVLNAFSYTGGFSVFALAGKASLVHSVDISKEATQICERNIALNFGQNVAHHQAIATDCFDYLRQTTEQYEVIVLDPPAFAKSAKTVPNAARGYKDLNLLGFKNIQAGGIIFTFSCSGNIDKDLFRKIVFSAAADSGREVRILHQLTQPIDHPINIYHPEGEYLKGLVLYVA